jgi:hypothetical protein
MGNLERMWIAPVVDIRKAIQSMKLYGKFLADWISYGRLPEAEQLHLKDGYPCLFDRCQETPFDPHYFYQSVWASRLLARSGARAHVDLGSDIRFIGPLTVMIPMVTFIDVRPVKARSAGLHCIAASAVQLPFADRSISSLSCLHVAEHIGLGRYGDALDPTGTRRACAEMVRVLAPHADLFLSVPVGRPRVCFNAHRIHTPRQVMSYLKGLDLVEFSVVDDYGRFQEKADLDEMEGANYACGLFWLKSGQ